MHPVSLRTSSVGYAELDKPERYTGPSFWYLLDILKEQLTSRAQEAVCSFLGTARSATSTALYPLRVNMWQACGDNFAVLTGEGADGELFVHGYTVYINILHKCTESTQV